MALRSTRAMKMGDAFSVLEAGVTGILADAARSPRSPGGGPTWRRTDIKNCIGIDALLRNGLIHVSFVPPAHQARLDRQPSPRRLLVTRCTRPPSPARPIRRSSPT